MEMKEYILTLSDLDINKNEIYLNLGYGGQTPDQPFIEMTDQMLEQIGNFCMPRKVGPVITKYLYGATHFSIFVVTAGEEYDNYLEQFKAEGDIVSEYLAYSIGTEIAEATVRYITDLIKVEAEKSGCKITNSYSPGYCSWHVCEQQQLFLLLPENPCGIKLNTSSLMHPVKSVSGMVGIGPDVTEMPYACDICGMQTCYKRKTTHQE